MPSLEPNVPWVSNKKPILGRFPCCFALNLKSRLRETQMVIMESEGIRAE